MSDALFDFKACRAFLGGTVAPRITQPASADAMLPAETWELAVPSSTFSKLRSPCPATRRNSSRLSASLFSSFALGLQVVAGPERLLLPPSLQVRSDGEIGGRRQQI